MTELVDLDRIATEGPAAHTEPWSLRPVEPPKATRTFPTIKRSTFMGKVKFYWREQEHGASTLYFATCKICIGPMWQANDTQRTQLMQMTARHKERHWAAADGNTPLPLGEGA